MSDWLVEMSIQVSSDVVDAERWHTFTNTKHTYIHTYIYYEHTLLRMYRVAENQPILHMYILGLVKQTMFLRSLVHLNALQLDQILSVDPQCLHTV